MNMNIDNGDVNGDYCHINSSTGPVINNNNPIYLKKKRDKFSTKIYLGEIMD